MHSFFDQTIVFNKIVILLNVIDLVSKYVILKKVKMLFLISLVDSKFAKDVLQLVNSI